MSSADRQRAAEGDTAAALHDARKQCASAQRRASGADGVVAAVRGMRGAVGTELKRALVSSKVNSYGASSRRYRTLPREVQQLKERLEDELRAAIERWVRRTTDDGAELDDAWASKLADGARLLVIDIADCVSAVRAAYTGRLASRQDSMEELRRAWALAAAGISALGSALEVEVAPQLGRIGDQLSTVADSMPEVAVHSGANG